MEDKKLPQIRVFQYLHIASSKLQNDSNFLLHRFIFKYINIGAKIWSMRLI